MTDASPVDGSRSHVRALLVLIGGACTIGLGPIMVRLADAGPSAVGFWRLTFALPLLAILARQQTGGIGKLTPITLITGLTFGLDLAFWHYGIEFSSVAKATVLSNLTPVLVTAVAWLVFRQKPRRLFLVAVAMAVAGAWIMAAARGGGAMGKSPALGDALSAMTAVWYALYFLAVSRARQSQGASRIMFWSSLTGAPLLLGIALALHEQILPGSARGWVACVGLGVMHVVGQGSIAWALGKLPPATTSVVVLVQPVVAGLLGWLIFQEAFGPVQILGGAIALSGVILAQWASRPQAEASPA